MSTNLVLGIVFLVGPAFLNSVVTGTISSQSGEVLGAVGNSATEFLSFEANPITLSRFEEKLEEVSEVILFETKYQEDEEMEWGREEVLEEGVDGKRNRTYRVTFWDGKEIDRGLVGEETIPSEPKVISRGTKVVWREVPGEGYRYWAKLCVWSTSYDGNCAGCRGLTYSGTPVRRGVCAVDPAVIPLGTNFYVPGYGICRAEDIGGGIKGKEIDLGFEDVSKGFWSARYTNVYLLTNAPD